jgi:hypothetical protein
MAILSANRVTAGNDFASSVGNTESRGAEGQWRERTTENMPSSAMSTSPLPRRDGNGEIEITAIQKMWSAMSGSLATALIGTSWT